MCFQKRFSQASLLISKQNYNVLSGILIFCKVQHQLQSFNIFSNGIVNLQWNRRFIFPDQNYKDGPLIFLFPFLKLHIWDLELRFGLHLLGSCNPISLDRLIFSIYFSNYEKLKSLGETFTPYIIKYVFFGEQLCMSNMVFCI